MKRIFPPAPQGTSYKALYFFHSLILLAALLGLLLIIGTIFGLARSSDAKPLFRLGKPRTTERTGGALQDGVSVFSGIGRLRIPLSNSSTLILSIAFPYPASDITFTEELAVKIGDFRSIAVKYFSSLPAEKLINLDEAAAKTEILKAYNASLRLGRIEALYFSDMLVIDGSQ